MRNALTIDLEDYYHVTAYRASMAPAEWNRQESRVERATDLLLDLLQEANCKATFFTLAWVAERNPQLVRRVASLGHEIACHSLRHRVVYEMTRDEFWEDTRLAKELLENVSGSLVRGYRAPSFTITDRSLWALEVLAELGFTYDSSIFPVNHPDYGIPGAPREPFVIGTPAGPLTEFPLTTLEIVGKRSPFGGGAYLRLLPYWYTRWGIRYLNGRENRSVCVYLHPWEMDPEQPRMSGTLTARLRHRLGLRGVEHKLRRLLRDFEFCSMGSLLDEMPRVNTAFSVGEAMPVRS
jgi:polysaccharide deacetylase family protein (PEP-CTERM system associated)